MDLPTFTVLVTMMIPTETGWVEQVRLPLPATYTTKGRHLCEKIAKQLTDAGETGSTFVMTADCVPTGSTKTP